MTVVHADRAIAKKILRGDENAFRELFDSFFPRALPLRARPAQRRPGRGPRDGTADLLQGIRATRLLSRRSVTLRLDVSDLQKHDYGHGPAPAEIGCFASHLELWRHCIELDDPS